MCGRYALYGPRKRSRAETAYFESIEQFPGSWNVAPGQTLPITRLNKDGAPEEISARWGLVPYWSKEEKIGYRCINARAESVATAPAFRGAYRPSAAVSYPPAASTNGRRAPLTRHLTTSRALTSRCSRSRASGMSGSAPT